MSVVSEIVRPISSEGMKWVGSPTNIDDPIVNPDTTEDGEAVGATSTNIGPEQVFVLSVPETAFATVDQVDVHVRWGSVIEASTVSLRIRINGVWSSATTVSLPTIELFAPAVWETHQPSDVPGADRITDVAVGLTLLSTTTAVVLDVLYVEFGGPARLMDPAGDLLYFDHLVPVTLRRASGEETAIGHAKRREITTEEAGATESERGSGSGGRYWSGDVVWHVSVAELAIAPDVGDEIVDGMGKAWFVTEVENASHGSRWVCRSRRSEIAELLDTLVTIQIASFEQTADGSVAANWSDWMTDVRARVQPVMGNVTTEHGQRHLSVTHHVILEADVSITENHRIIQGSRVFHVLGYESSERIDRLMVVRVTETPWPLG